MRFYIYSTDCAYLNTYLLTTYSYLATPLLVKIPTRTWPTPLLVKIPTRTCRVLGGAVIDQVRYAEIGIIHTYVMLSMKI